VPAAGKCAGLHRARGGAPEGQTEWKLQAWRQIEGTHQALETNQITAKTMNYNIPNRFLLRADKIIE
jgi:hypothetical protein